MGYWELLVITYTIFLTNDGVMFSFSYGDPNMDIRYAENFIYTLVTYSKIQGGVNLTSDDF